MSNAVGKVVPGLLLYIQVILASGLAWKLQVTFRGSLMTGLWSVRSSLMVGFAENYCITKDCPVNL